MPWIWISIVGNVISFFLAKNSAVAPLCVLININGSKII